MIVNFFIWVLVVLLIVFISFKVLDFCAMLNDPVTSNLINQQEDNIRDVRYARIVKLLTGHYPFGVEFENNEEEDDDEQ